MTYEIDVTVNGCFAAWNEKPTARFRPKADANIRASSDGVPRDATLSRSLVTYALPDADLGNEKMAENWRARQDSNLRPQA